MLTFVGGYSEDRQFPTDHSCFLFEPGANIIDAESFATEDARVLKTRLFMTFGAFDLVSMSMSEWSVEQPGRILGTVRVYHLLDGTEYCVRNGASTVQSKITAFDRGVSS